MTGRAYRAFVNALKALAKADVDNRHNIVAVIEKGGNIISIGVNEMDKTHPIFYNGVYDKCIHAEFAAIRQLNESQLNGSSIYVFYFRKSGGLGNSHPCPDCMRLIKDSGIKRVYYFSNDKLRVERIK